MYNRSYRQRRPPTVPINYSGNVFDRQAHERGNFDVMPIPHAERENERDTEKCEAVCDTPCDVRGGDIDRGKCDERGKPNFLSGLFGGKLFPRGIGNEELLLLALILLVAQSGDGDELLIYLVILLLT